MFSYFIVNRSTTGLGLLIDNSYNAKTTPQRIK